MSLATLTVTDHWTDGKRIHVVGTLAFTGNYVQGGYPLNLSSDQIKSSGIPEYVSILGQTYYYAGGSQQLDWGYRYKNGNSIANGTVVILSGGTEISTGALPAGLANESITFYAIFPKFIGVVRPLF